MRNGCRLAVSAAAQRLLDRHGLTVALAIVTWLSGHWVGEGLCGVVEEWWSAPGGGAMMGVFRLTSGEETEFYELFTISEEKGQWGMRLQHFHSVLKGWEENDEPLVWESTVLEEGKFGFGPVFYELEDEDTMRVAVETGNGSAEFLYRRAD